MLKLLDSQKTHWVLAAFLASGAIALLRSRMGWWSVPVAPVFAIAAWVGLRFTTEAAIRRWAPEWVASHLSSMIATDAEPSYKAVWLDPISRRIATEEYRRLWKHVHSDLREELVLAKKLAQGDSSDVVSRLRFMASRWLQGNRRLPRRTALQLIDPVHFSISFPGSFSPLIEHQLMQRLNEVRQLAFAFPAFPSGTHTRMAHSLGVAHLAATAMRIVTETDVVYKADGKESLGLNADDGRRLACLAAICGLVHDTGHPPLGHTLDRFFASRIPEGSDIADKKFLPLTLEGLHEVIENVDGVRFEDVAAVFSDEKDGLTGWFPFISSLISSELDVDRLDYLQRDAHFTGQQEGLLNVARVLEGIRPFRRGDSIFLTFDMSILPEIEQFVYAREVMYLRCYERAEKVVSEWLVLRAMNHLFMRHPELESEMNEFRLLTDAQLVEVVRSSKSETAKMLLERVYNSDARNYHLVASVPFEANALEGHLLGLRTDFTKRKKKVFERVEGYVAEIAEQASVDNHDVLLVLPDLRLSDDRKTGLDIWLLRDLGADQYVPTRLLSEKTDASVSELLRRHKYVSLGDVMAATDLKVLKEEAKRTGVSLLHLLRRPRNQLRLYLHKRAMPKAQEAKEALKEMGVLSPL